MTLTDLVSSPAASSTSSLATSLANNKTAAKSTNAVSGTSSSLQKAETRIQAAVDQTTTRLSAMGKLKSAVSEVQLASRALHSLTTTASGASVKLAVSSLVTAYNNAIKTARVTAAVTGAPTETASAQRASRELLQSVATDATTLASLKKIGISVLPDGTLAVDTKALDAAQASDPTAMRTTLSKLGVNVDKAATQSLASKDSQTSLGNALSSLNQRATALQAQQAGLATLAQNLAAATKSNGNSGFGSYGLAAYLK